MFPCQSVMVPIQFLLGMLADMREGIKGTDKGKGTTPVQFLQWSSVGALRLELMPTPEGGKGSPACILLPC